jgi:ABC-type molybdate transport system substrate-binding protein
MSCLYACALNPGRRLTIRQPVQAVLDQPPIEYVVAQARDPQSDTQPFMAFVKSAAAQAAFKSAGLAPIDDAQAVGRPQ